MKVAAAHMLAIYVKDGQKYVAQWRWDIDEKDVKYNPAHTVNGKEAEAPEKTVEAVAAFLNTAKVDSVFYKKESEADAAILATAELIKDD